MVSVGEDYVGGEMSWAVDLFAVGAVAYAGQEEGARGEGRC